MDVDRRTIAKDPRMVRMVIQPQHPSVDQLYDALSEAEWEALAVAASEGVVTMPAIPEIAARLQSLGLVMATSYPTAAGFALLLAWHRRHLPRPWWRDWRRWEDRRHEVRMRLLIDKGASSFTNLVTE